VEEQVKHLFRSTELTLRQIATELGVSYKFVWKATQQHFTQEERDARSRANYIRSKLGDKNPMTGKFGALHHNYIGGEVEDGKGYIMILKPDWYTGRTGSKYIFKHNAVMCEALGLTEMPPGYVVHHVDEDKTNNELSNLAMMTMAAHARLHALLRKAAAKE